MKIELLLLLASLSITACASANDFYYEYGKKVQLTKLKEQRSNTQVTYYQTQNGHKVGVKDEIIVQCQENTNCLDTLTDYSLTNISKLSDEMYLIKLNDKSKLFKLSQKLHNEESIKFAHPNFLKEKKKR